MRVNKAIEDGSFFENPALLGAFERGKRVHLLGLVSNGGVHSHIDHVRALLRFAPEKTWIHAFTDGRDVSPHAALADLATLPLDRIATRRRPVLRDGPRPALGADAARVRRGRPGTWVHMPRARWTPCRRATTRASPTSSSSRSSIEGTPRLEPGDSAIFFNFRPDRGAAALAAPARRGVRPDDDDALQRRARLPGRVRGAGRAATRSPTCSRRTGSRQLHAAETEKYAHVTYFFNGGVEAEHDGETRHPRPEPARRAELRPEAGDVGAPRSPSASAPRSATATLRRRQLREPGHGRPHRRRSRRSSRPSRRPTAASGASSSAWPSSAACASSRPTTATPSSCSSPTASRRTRPTRRTRCRSSSPSAGDRLRDGGELADLAPTMLRLLGVDPPAGDER